MGIKDNKIKQGISKPESFSVLFQNFRVYPCGPERVIMHKNGSEKKLYTINQRMVNRSLLSPTISQYTPSLIPPVLRNNSRSRSVILPRLIR
mgnify:CR=1 FL=1